MSAIVGIYYPSGKSVEERQLTKMTDILAHRGADGVDVWCDRHVGLGHRLLYTTPESLLERLPFVDSTGDFAITADARIDNRQELIPVLDFGNLSVTEITDSQIILAAYQKWGDKCPEKLLGDFAFAIWDKRQQQMFCARDHFGVKPFYYHSSPEIFAFATEIKAIFTEVSIPRQVNEARIADYLSSMFYDAEMTSYEQILRLPPASWMKISTSGKEIQTYWALDPEREIKLDSDEAYAAKFKEIFTEAVRCRLRSAYDLGFTLSGGLDSSSIACTAREIAENQPVPALHTFSAIFNELDCDEREYINPILEGGGLQPHFINSDKINPFDNLERALWHQDEAFYAPNWSMTWALYDRAQSEGVRIILNGFDGDSIVSHGYGYLSELAKAGRWLSLARQTRELAKTLDASFSKWYWSYIKEYGIKPIKNRYSPRKLAKKILQPFLKSQSPTNSYKSQLTNSNTILNSQFAAQIDFTERFKTHRQTVGTMGQDERQRHYLNITGGNLPFCLEVMDKSMAAFGIEPRYAFCDKRLIEFCLALPPEQKLNLGYGRIVMRRAMEGIVPSKVRWRREKTDFTPNFVRGLQYWKQQDWDKFVSQNQALLEEYIDLPALKQMIQKFIDPQQKASSKEARTLWLVISLVFWLSRTNESFSPTNNELSLVQS